MNPPLTQPRAFDELTAESAAEAGMKGAGNGRRRLGAVQTIAGEVVDAADLAAEIEALSAEQAIAWALERFHPKLRFAVSFQKTSSVILDIAHRLQPDSSFFYIDTNLLFEETYATRDRLAEHYGIEFSRFSGISLEMQEKAHGASLWRRHPDACCGIRKVEPMREALSGADCWVSGIRRGDSSTRAGTAKFGWDKRFGVWKLNPLADWSDEQVWKYIRENQVPYNPLHDEGYPSIGCTPCTVRPGEGADTRAGRWAGIDKTECGING